MEDKKEYLPVLEESDILPILNKISLFGGLSDKQLCLVIKLLQKVYYRSDEFIFRQGEEPGYIYVVRSGEVMVFAEEDQTPLELVTFTIGQCFGETSAIGIQSHSANAIAVKDTELIVLSREALLSFFENDKELFGMLILNVAREACRRLHQTDEVLLHYVRYK